MGHESYVSYRFECGCQIVKGYQECCSMGPWTGCTTDSHIKFCQIHNSENPPKYPSEVRACGCRQDFAYSMHQGKSRFPEFPQLYRQRLVLCSDHAQKDSYLFQYGKTYESPKKLSELSFLDDAYEKNGGFKC